MKILHTADWHLGKKLERFDRLSEQQKALDFLYLIILQEKIDLVVVAGDIFDQSNPSSIVEKFFVENIKKLSKLCPIVLISGNHDDNLKVMVTSAFALDYNVFLIGSLKNENLQKNNILTDVDLGNITLKIKNETINIGLYPYLTESKYRLELEEDNELEYDRIQRIKKRFSIVSRNFKKTNYSIFVAHLMLQFDENNDFMLGNLLPVPIDILPQADYIALGHIHRPLRLKDNIYYSGSLLTYHFNDKTEKKRFLIINLKNKKIEVKSIPIECSTQLLQINVNSITEAFTKLNEQKEKLFEVIYESNIPPTSLEIEELKKHENFVKLTIKKKNNELLQVFERKNMSSLELFKNYYKVQKDKEPSDELINLFLEMTQNNETTKN